MHLRLCGWADIVFVCVRKTEMFACSCDKWQWLPFEQRYGRSGTPCRGNYYRLHRPEVPRQTRRKIENINDLWCSEVYLLLCLCCWPQSVRYAGTSFSVASCSCSSVINPFRHSGVELLTMENRWIVGEEGLQESACSLFEEQNKLLQG